MKVCDIYPNLALLNSSDSITCAGQPLTPWREFAISSALLVLERLEIFRLIFFCTLKISKNFLYETSHFEYWFRRFRTWWHRKVSWLVKAINWPCFWPSKAHTIWLIQKWALMVRNTFWPRAYTPRVYRTCLEIF